MEDVDIERPSIQELNAEIGEIFLRIQEVVTMLFLRLRQRFLQTAVLLCMIVLLFWVAVFLYGSFYYSFMPTANFITPVHFYYRTHCPSAQYSFCSIPMANFSLLRNSKKQVMTYGKPYQITLELEMPESPANEQLGMFLVKISCYSHEGQIIDSSSRCTMLHYHSSLLQTLRTLTFYPLLLLEATEQKQRVLVEFFSSYIENSHKPTIGAVIEIYSQQVQIYSANLYIHAHFTGIRYILYHFPLASAVVGVTSNFTFLCMFILMSYLNATLDGILPNPQVIKWNKIRLRSAGAKDPYERSTHSEDHSAGMEADVDVNDPTGFAEHQSVSGADHGDIYLKHSFLSNSSVPSSDQDKTSCHSGNCLSS